MKHFSGESTEVVIVDDNPQYATILQRLLERHFGFRRLTIFHDTATALEYLSEDKSEEQRNLVAEHSLPRKGLLFVDYHFPNGETGGKLLRSLQSQGLLSGVATFLITSEPSVENLREAQAAGALGVIAKPFDQQELRKQLEKADRIFDMDEQESF